MAVGTAAESVLFAITLLAAKFAILSRVTALVAMAGKAAVPDKSPANWIFPLTNVVASGAPFVTAVVTKAVVAIAVELSVDV